MNDEKENIQDNERRETRREEGDERYPKLEVEVGKKVYEGEDPEKATEHTNGEKGDGKIVDEKGKDQRALAGVKSDAPTQVSCVTPEVAGRLEGKQEAHGDSQVPCRDAHLTSTPHTGLVHGKGKKLSLTNRSLRNVLSNDSNSPNDKLTVRKNPSAKYVFGV